MGSTERARGGSGALAVIDPDEIRALVKASDARGFAAVITTYGLIAASLASVALAPGAWRWPVGLVAIVVLGGRHLALAILMHEASHHSLFRTRALNDWIGAWLCGYPAWQDLHRYRVHHLAHHKLAGSERDPDIALVKGFPTSRRSLARKFLRDLSGITGMKRLVGLLLMDLGLIEYTVANAVTRADPREIDAKARGLAEGEARASRLGAMTRNGARNLPGVVVTSGALFLILWAAGHPWLFALWVGSYLTTFSVILRIRSIAEHACTGSGLDPLLNTRTTRAGLLARLTVAPHHVNYHLEHHVLMTVPYFRLPELHRMLNERGALGGAHIADSYLDVLRLVSRPAGEERA